MSDPVELVTKLTTRRGTVEVRTVGDESQVDIEHDGSGLMWSVTAPGLDRTALHLKALFEGLQSIADGDLEIGVG